MKIVSWWHGEIVVVLPLYFRFIKWWMKAPRMPRAAASWPFLMIYDEAQLEREWLLNHERIHFAQQRETLIIGQMILKFVETCWARWWLRKSRIDAYFWTACEQEAYLNMHKLDYLKMRPRFAMLKYVFQKRRFRLGDVPGEIEFY